MTTISSENSMILRGHLSSLVLNKLKAIFGPFYARTEMLCWTKPPRKFKRSVYVEKMIRR